MENQVIQSTSRTSATCSDVPLRTTQTRRLVFRPVLVTNSTEPDASVRGWFIYQRKRPDDTWEDIPTDSLATLKAGEGYQLELHAAELLALFRAVAPLYRLHRQRGIPSGRTEFVAVDEAAAKLASLGRDQLRAFWSANEALGDNVLAGLLDWVSGAHHPTALVQRLLALGPAAVENLNVALGLGRLKQALEMWRDNDGNPDEEFWQQTLAEHAFVLDRVFAWPMIVVQGKAYLGGKRIDNTGGSLVDFLMKNPFTQNAALVEIKTPATRLLAAKPYRDGVLVPSSDLTGAVMQVLKYRATLMSEVRMVAWEMSIDAFAPRCVVIAGSAAEFEGDEERRRSFELYRASVPDVTIITYDELFRKTGDLVALLEATA